MSKQPTVKATFVLNHIDKPAAAIIALAKREGLKLSQSYVHYIRSKKTPQSPRPGKPGPKPRAVGVAQVTLSKRSRGPERPGTRPQHAEFTHLVMRVGTERANEWLAALDAAPVAI